MASAATAPMFLEEGFWRRCRWRRPRGTLQVEDGVPSLLQVSAALEPLVLPGMVLARTVLVFPDPLEEAEAEGPTPLVEEDGAGVFLYLLASNY